MKANTTGAFIVFASGRIDVGLIDSLCALGSVDLIGYSTNAEEAVSQILENKPKIVIIDSHNAMTVACRVIRELWSMALVIIVV